MKLIFILFTIFCSLCIIFKVITAKALENRIIGGDPVTKINYYEVAIISDNDNEDITDVQICTGVLLNVEWVLTSAYCAARKTNLRVQYGVQEIDTTGEEGPLVYKKYIHPYYNPACLINDIALLKLNPPATGKIRVVKLPDNTLDRYVGKRGNVSGWGAIGSYLEYNPILTSKRVNVINNSNCQAAGLYMTPYKICSEGRTVCEGDQGAPLVWDGTLIGIASIALNAYKCEEMVATTFTRVNYYLSWIHQIMQK